MSQESDIDVSADGCQEMISSLGIHAPITTFRNDHKVRVSQFRSCRHRKATAMKTIEEVCVQVVRCFRSLTDPCNEEYLVRFQTSLDQRLFHRLQKREVSTSRAPCGFIFTIIFDIHHDSLPLSINFEICQARNARPIAP